MRQASLLDMPLTEPRGRRVRGPEGSLLRAWDVHHRAAGLGGYRMHGGDVKALRALLDTMEMEALADLVALYWDVLDSTRGTDEARYWRPTVCCFASQVPALRARFTADGSKLTAEQVAELNLAGWLAYQAVKEGQPEAANPYPRGTQRWRRWRMFYRIHKENGDGPGNLVAR